MTGVFIFDKIKLNSALDWKSRVILTIQKKLDRI